MPRRKEPRIPDAVLDQLLAGADPKTAFDPNGLIDDLKKALTERVLNAEMDHHLAGEELGNRRNGYGKKTVITDTGQIVEVPRDRQARVDPPAGFVWPSINRRHDDRASCSARRAVLAWRLSNTLGAEYCIEAL